MSTFPPTQCGIATYTDDLIANLGTVDSYRVRMLYQGECSSDHDWRTINLPCNNDYALAAAAINDSDTGVVSLQHEFGIYGGADGELVLSLLQLTRKPVVTTLHTTSARLSRRRLQIIETLARYSTLVVVLSEQSADFIVRQVQIPESQVRVIRHGIPEAPFSWPEDSDLRTSGDEDIVFVSAGHVKPKKGYDIAFGALAKLKSLEHRFTYLILGTSQKQWNPDGAWCAELQSQIREFGLDRDVLWIDRFLTTPDLVRYIQSADIGLVMYRDESQTSSGILPLILGCGRPVITTPFAYAHSLANLVDGVYICAGANEHDVYEKILEAMVNRGRLREKMVATHRQTRKWLWPRTAALYRNAFEAAFGFA